MPKRILAFDIGAENGRAVLGVFNGKKLTLEEVYRFHNEPVKVRETLYWDILKLFSEVKNSLQICSKKYGSDISSIGFDTWGIDFGLLNKDGDLLSSPVHYRDKRTYGMLKEVEKKISKFEIYNITGMEISPITTILQLFSMRNNNSSILKTAKTFLMIPDIFNYFITGEKSCEETDAITTLFFDINKKKWAKEIFKKLDLPFEIMPEVKKSGTIIGKISDREIKDLGFSKTLVVAPATHDTGSAVASIPGNGNFAFISSGTWSVVGTLIKNPIINEDSFNYGFCNEITFGSLFLAKNIMGLWIIQELKRGWGKRGKDFTYEDLKNAANKAEQFLAMINPNDVSFLAPDNMEYAIIRFCKKSGQRTSFTHGEITRVVLESLAFSYRYTLDKMKELLDKSIECLHIVGGGIQNTVLCQFVANATGLPVITGPKEATAIGNIMVQAIALKEILNADDIRSVLRNSFEMKTYEPKERNIWDEQYQKYLKLQKK